MLDERDFVRAQLASATVAAVVLQALKEQTKYDVSAYLGSVQGRWAQMAVTLSGAEELRVLPEFSLALKAFEFNGGGPEVVTAVEVLRVLADGEEEPSGSSDNIFEATWGTIALLVSENIFYLSRELLTDLVAN
jgi:hypothetical protein